MKKTGDPICRICRFKIQETIWLSQAGIGHFADPRVNFLKTKGGLSGKTWKVDALF